MKEEQIGHHTRKIFCETCSSQSIEEPPRSMSPAETKEHLEKVHGLTSLKGSRILVMALDGDFYRNTFKWEVGGVKLTEISSGPARHH